MGQDMIQTASVSTGLSPLFWVLVAAIAALAGYIVHLHFQARKDRKEERAQLMDIITKNTIAHGDVRFAVDNNTKAVEKLPENIMTQIKLIKLATKK